MKLTIKKSCQLSLACFCMLTSTVVSASDYEGHWAQNAIDTWSTHQVVKGQAEGVFAPNAPVTRAELATFIDRLFTIEPTDVPRTYTDIAADAWYTEAIKAVTSHGYMYTPGDVFKPNDYATREEVAYAMAKAYNLQPHSEQQQLFTDDSNISVWAKDSVYTLAGHGYINGNPDGTFKPQDQITRAELVTIIDNMTHNYIRESGTYTTVKPGNVVINAKDVTLSDVTVEGNVYITDAAVASTILLEDVNVTGKVYVHAGNITLDGSYHQVEVKSGEPFTLSKGSIDELVVSEAGTQLTLESGTMTDHLVLTAQTENHIEGTVLKTTSNQKAPMNITEAGVIIGGELVPVYVDNTTITINLLDLLDSITYTDVMEGLIVYTDVEGAYLSGYAGGKLMTNTEYSFRQADYQLGMIAEMLDQVTSQSNELAEIADMVGVTPDTIFFMLADQGEISIRHMIRQFEEVNNLAGQYIGGSLPTEFTFKRDLHYGKEKPIEIEIKLEIQ